MIARRMFLIRRCITVAVYAACVILVAPCARHLAHAQEVPSFILGRPTASSIAINALADAGELYFELGQSSGVYTQTTQPLVFTDGPVETRIDDLAPDTRYYYRAQYRPDETSSFAPGPEHTFHTQRAPGSGFIFTIQADSHQGYTAFHDPDLYRITFDNQAADDPDFIVDLGDTFSLDDATETVASVRQKYLDQRQEFARVAHSMAVFLVLGNHENEEGWNLDDKPNRSDSLPVLGANARKRYFENPIPDDFYAGNTDVSIPEIEGDHLKEDYYAFQWGDALFVAIDPFWYTTRKPFAGSAGGEQNDEVVGNRWDWTLGWQQYEWLRTTLENSDAPFKFVFSHHLVGGISDYAHGGALGAKYCEWGGYDVDGVSWGFSEQRPDLVMPIHEMLAANGVTVLFHGHDHVFATEALDGVVYQECPHAANSSYGIGFLSNYTYYADAQLIANSGHLRVTVSATEAWVEYVRAFLPGDGVNGDVAASYSLTVPGANHKPSANDDDDATTIDRPIAIDVLGNDHDDDGDLLSVVGVSQPQHGTAQNRGVDAYYAPEPGYCDGETPDFFRYAIKDGKGGSRTATVRVTVRCECEIAADCDDGDACTTDSCAGGRCAHEPVDCDDGDVCTIDACDPLVGCTYSARSCDDGVECTVDSCDSAGGCLNVPDGEACDDFDPCTGDSCTLDGCTHTPLVCDDGDLCTSDACVDGACVFVPVDCGSDICTVSACDPQTGLCGGSPLDCEDGNPCTDDACDEDLGCVHTERDCGPSTRCAARACDPSSGSCVVTPVDCDDGNPCTDDACDEDLGCVHSDNAAACDDGEPCTHDDRCRDGRCVGFTLDCSALDGACQVGRCDGIDPASCIAVDLEDGTACDDGGRCESGACVPPSTSSDGGEYETGDAGNGDAGQAPGKLQDAAVETNPRDETSPRDDRPSSDQAFADGAAPYDAGTGGDQAGRDGSGCGCRVSGQRTRSPLRGLLLLVLVVAAARRRRARIRRRRGVQASTFDQHRQPVGCGSSPSTSPTATR